MKRLILAMYIICLSLFMYSYISGNIESMIYNGLFAVIFLIFYLDKGND